MTPSARRLAAVPAAILVAVAAAQIVLATRGPLSPWKGGGFGMFASLDGGPHRFVRAFALAPQRSEEIAVPASLDRLAKKAEILPVRDRLERLGGALAARERRHGRPVRRVRVEVWRIDYRAGSLDANLRLLARREVHASPPASGE